jgi:hypothetical protein
LRWQKGKGAKRQEGNFEAPLPFFPRRSELHKILLCSLIESPQGGKPMSTLRKKLDFLVRMQGEVESIIFAKAIEMGITQLYADAVAEAYLSGKIERDEALAELGAEKVEEIDYALTSIERDVEWGLRDE